jgi:hypothetical protein
VQTLKDMDWKKLAAKQVKPPKIPAKGTGNFDSQFTSQPAAITPVDPSTLKEIDQQLFANFSYTHQGGSGGGGGGDAPAPAPARSTPTAASASSHAKSVKPTAADKAALMAGAMKGIALCCLNRILYLRMLSDPTPAGLKPAFKPLVSSQHACDQ